MILKAFVYDTTDREPREITVNQIMCKEGKPYAIFSSDSKMRYEKFHIWDDTKPCKWNDYKETSH